MVIFGEIDMQVPPEGNIDAMKTAFSEGGNKDYRIIEIRGVNHLFQPTETGAPSEYGVIEETISPEILAIIGDWINEKTK
ncbi:hypothetical protein KAH81_00175 [bacterium]|nr:hypothetical protein [bacterium]